MVFGMVELVLVQV